MDRWVGQTAVVTGASAGIGAATCVRLADAGMRVVGLARRAQLVENLQSLVTGPGSIVARQCDVSQPAEVAAAFAWVDVELGGTGALVNNAGVFFPGQITDVGPHPTKEEDLLKTIAINFSGVVLCARRAVASMRARGFAGHVININSIAGHYTPFAPMFNVYPGSKHAVTGFSASLDNELADFGSSIKVTFECPLVLDVGPHPTKEEDLLKTIAINFSGVVLCARRAVASMRARGFAGHVININSIAGHYTPFAPMFNVYPGSKHAVTGFSASLDNELADFGSSIKVTSISPGLVDTEMVSGGAGGAGPVPPTPLPALPPALRPADVADAVLYVLSTPPTVNINELTITPVGGKRL